MRRGLAADPSCTSAIGAVGGQHGFESDDIGTVIAELLPGLSRLILRRYAEAMSPRPNC